MAESLKQKTIIGTLWSSVDRFASAGINFILGLVLARLLLPKEYGLIAMISIFMAISQSIIDSGFSNALIRKKIVQKQIIQRHSILILSWDLSCMQYYSF